MADASELKRVVDSLDLTAEQRGVLAESAVATVAVEVYRQVRLQRSEGMAGSCSIIGNCSGGPGCDIIGNCSSSKLVSAQEVQPER